MSLTQHEKYERLNPELQLTVDFLNSLPEVSKVVLGTVHLCKHQKKGGEFKIVGRTKPNLILARGFFDGGTRELFVYTPDDKSADSLLGQLHKGGVSEQLAKTIEEGRQAIKRLPPEFRQPGSSMRVQRTIEIPAPGSLTTPVDVQQQIKKAAKQAAAEERARKQLEQASRTVEEQQAREQEATKIIEVRVPSIPKPPVESCDSIPPGAKPSAEWLTITPAIASHWLNKFNVHNRPMKENAIARYTMDMKSGRWNGHTHQGVAFYKNPFHDEDAILLDGQNRLWGVVLSEATVIMQVNVNIPLEAQKSMDDHVKRTVRDVYALEHRREGVTTAHIACANRMVTNALSHGWTRQELYDFIERHWGAIDFAVRKCFRNSTRRSITIAPVYAAVARASYHEDHDKLIRFGVVLLDGMTTNESETAAIILRNWLLSQTPGASSGAREVVFRKAERAIAAFVQQEKIAKLYEASEELYPLPEEQAAK